MVFIVVGCGGKTIKTNNGSMTVKNGNVQVKSNDGSTTNIATNESGKLSLPQGYPEDILPVIDNAKITASQNSTKDSKKSFLVSLEVNKSSEDVIKYYQDKTNDITDKNETNAGNQYILTGKKGEYTVTIYISPANNDAAKTNVILSIDPAN